MSNLSITAIVGSIIDDSLNKKLLKNMIELAPKNVSVTVIELGDLPLYSQTKEVNLPEPVKKLKESIEKSNAVLIITPEHNRSIPASLKNAIDWASRPWGQNSWAGKPVAIAGATMGPIGTFGAQAHLRNILAYLDTSTMTQPEFYFTAAGRIDDNGKITDKDTLEKINTYWTAFTKWIDKVEA